MKKNTLLVTCFFILMLQNIVFAQWQKLDSAIACKGKQDDIFFINENVGWYVNGLGKIFKT